MRNVKHLFGGLAALGLLLSVALTGEQEKPAELNVGDDAPAWEALNDKGEKVKSSDVYAEGKWVVIYFYPADLTGGCTKQACSFRDDAENLKKNNILVFGVSGDSVRNHQLFKQVHTLNFPLLADENGAVAKAFGVPLGKGGSIEREINGKTETLTRGVTAQRWTFLINPQGKIAAKKTKVNAEKDSQEILETVNKKE